MAEKTVVALIILIVSFMLILGVIKVFVSRADDISGELICRGSIAARAKFYLGTADEKQSMAPILCKTKLKDIPLSSKDADEEAVKKDMADLVRRCWWQFGNGLVTNVYDDWFFGDNKCFVCYIVEIDDLNQVKEGIEKEEFLVYLSQTYIKEMEEDKGTDDIDVEQYTYTQYVQSSGGNGKIEIDVENFFPKNKYAIAFVSPKFFTNWDEYKSRLGFGDDEYKNYNYILIDDYTEIQNKCEVVQDVTEY